MNRIVYNNLIVAKEAQNLELMEKIYNSNKNDVQIKFEFARLLVLKGKTTKAKEILLELLKTKNKMYAMFELGKIESSLNNYDVARSYFESILKMDKNDKHAKLELARLEANCGNMEKARNHYNSILEVENDPFAKLELGRLEARVGNVDVARRHFKPLLNTVLDKNSKDLSKFELARLEASVGNYELAKEYLNSLLNSSIKTFSYVLLVLLEYKDNNYKEAVSIANEAISKNCMDDYRVLLALSKQLNIYFNIDYNKINYTYSTIQLLDYDSILALDHIATNHDDTNTKSNFNKNVDIYKLFMNINSKLTDEYKVNKLVLNDVYIIPYENVGSKNQAYLRVVTLPNTKDIITMYPVEHKYDEYYDSDDDLKQLVKK